jgi:hypothetical protein
MHEEVIRKAVSLTNGVKWGRSIEINGITDVFNFVSDGLQKGGNERAIALERLFKRLTTGYESISKVYNPPHEKRTN